MPCVSTGILEKHFDSCSSKLVGIQSKGIYIKYTTGGELIQHTSQIIDFIVKLDNSGNKSNEMELKKNSVMKMF